MKRINQTLCVAVVALALMACRKDKDANSPESMGDGPAERTGEDIDESTRDAEESLEDAEEEMEESMDEARRDLDGNPATD